MRKLLWAFCKFPRAGQFSLLFLIFFDQNFSHTHPKKSRNKKTRCPKNADPFVKLDRVSVGALVEMAVERARAVKPGLRCGLSGGHAADADCVEFCHEVGIDYVSCAPHRVPIARLAAGRAALKKEGVEG